MRGTERVFPRCLPHDISRFAIKSYYITLGGFHRVLLSRETLVHLYDHKIIEKDW